MAAGKAAWQMAHAAVAVLGRVDGGLVVTKYGHVRGSIPGVVCCEAGHPVPDENGFAATERALELVRNLTADDTVLFLLSGGGSALLEKPLLPAAELQDITRQLLASGADIVEITVSASGCPASRADGSPRPAPRRRSTVSSCPTLWGPTGYDRLRPAYPDSSTCAQARAIAARYGLRLSPLARELLDRETPKTLDNVTTRVTGSVRELCAAAAAQCRTLGYETVLLTDCLNCEAREAGRFLASVLRTHAGSGRRLAFVAGGETVVHLTGNGLGGRNQELALGGCRRAAGVGKRRGVQRRVGPAPTVPPTRRAAMWTALPCRRCGKRGWTR